MYQRRLTRPAVLTVPPVADYQTIDVLPDIVRAVGHRCEVYMDSGVRQGTDVVKALALGARAVFVGRPVIFGLAYNVSASPWEA
ncbi:hypothetical protein HPB48_016852 [Haemaphysalis longicornis]|uniref:FMN-dependent dehydrogenase domain-containing protein n=1 Tax=Haemaphysalis longicornis TaxID=44386 RepID=A0A9J6FR37_HAELO|nr:hypothetical protein HPB48_016852 [Haemaphysalis longicornis]